MLIGFLCVSALNKLYFLCLRFTKFVEGREKHTEVVEYHPIEWMGQGGARHDYRFGGYGYRGCSTLNDAVSCCV
jgi:hypothetical protein